MKHVNILKHPVFFAIPVVICLCLYFFSKSSLATGDIFGTEKVRKRYDTMRKTSVAALPPAAPVAAAVAMNNYSSAGVQNDSPVEQKTVTGYYQDAGLYHVLYSDGSVVKTQIRPVVDQSPRSVAVASAFRQVASASGVSPVLPPSGRLMDGPVDVVNVHHGVKRGEFGGLE